jgi:hypothetical protein
LELQIPTLVILDIQALLVKTDTIINMDSPLRKGPSPSNLDQGHILSLILGEIEMQYPLLGLSAPIHNVPKATLRPLPPQMAFVLDLGPRVEKKCAVHREKNFPPHPSCLPSSSPHPARLPASPLHPPALPSIMAKPAGALAKPVGALAKPVGALAKPAGALVRPEPDFIHTHDRTTIMIFQDNDSPENVDINHLHFSQDNDSPENVDINHLHFSQDNDSPENVDINHLHFSQDNDSPEKASLNYDSRFLISLQMFLPPLHNLLSLGRQGLIFHWKKKHAEAEALTHTNMFPLLDIKIQIPSPDCPRMILPDSSKIGFCGRPYSIIIKTTPLGIRYLFRLDNLIFKLFIFILHPLHNSVSMNGITVTEIFGNVLFRSYDIVNIFTKLQLSHIYAVFTPEMVQKIIWTSLHVMRGWTQNGHRFGYID